MAGKSPSPLVIGSLRGGVNNTDPAIALPGDQCTIAENVEWIASTLGERRRGMTPIDLTGSGLSSESDVTFLGRHLPTNDEADAELWALGVTGTSTATLARKSTAWSAVTMPDAIDLTSGSQHRISAVSLHGKYFIAYKSSANRLHVWDGTSLRKAGIAAPANAPTGANAGSGTFTGTRYYRVRWTVQAAAVTTRRSEPSAVLTFAPSGTGASVTVTRPTNDSESATHWEIEASTDNANFYRVSTIAVATTTYSDSAAYVPGYAANPLSEDIEDYALLPSCRFLAADEDRLLMFGSWTNDALGSRVAWTPVYGGPGAGNDERMETDTDPFLDLDGFDGGRLTGGTNSINGVILATKRSRIYKLVRTGNRANAYAAITLSKTRGAIEGSLVEGMDEAGRPCVFFLDPEVGPCRYGANGLQQCGSDIFTTWQTVNVNASTIVCRAVYYPAAKQVHWWIATGSSNTPDLRIVLHTQEARIDEHGNVRRGWALWTGLGAQARAVCLFAENIDAGSARSYVLRPFIAVSSGSTRVHRGDTGDDDSGTAYTARIVTRPYTLASILNEFGVMAGALLAKAAAGVSVVITAVRDFGLETKSVTADLTPTAAEDQVIVALDDLSFAELKAVQFEFSDPVSTAARWELNQLATKPRGEATA